MNKPFYNMHNAHTIVLFLIPNVCLYDASLLPGTCTLQQMRVTLSCVWEYTTGARGAGGLTPDSPRRLWRIPPRWWPGGASAGEGEGAWSSWRKERWWMGSDIARSWSQSWRFSCPSTTQLTFCKIVTKWFEERPHIQLIAWPGNFPHLNPIKYVWSWMKGQLYQNTTVTNMEDWKGEIKKLWAIKMADSGYLKKLLESMPRRLQDVIERGGACTKY